MRDFVLVCTPRSGSTVTGKLLAAHPQVKYAGELLFTPPKAARRWRRRLYVYLPIVPLLQQRAAQKRNGIGSFGFKFFPTHVANPSGFIALLRRLNFAVIGLERSSLFSQALSAAVFVRPGPRQRFKDAAIQEMVARKEPITVDEQHFLTQLALMHRQRLMVRKVLTAVSPHIRLIYERDVQSEESKPLLHARLIEAAGLPSVPYDAAYLPARRSRSELVTNRERLQELAASYAAEHGIALFDPAI